MASGLNIAAFNVGIAPWIGAVVVLGALALTYWSGRLDRREGLVAQGL